MWTADRWTGAHPLTDAGMLHQAGGGSLAHATGSLSRDGGMWGEATYGPGAKYAQPCNTRNKRSHAQAARGKPPLPPNLHLPQQLPWWRRPCPLRPPQRGLQPCGPGPPAQTPAGGARAGKQHVVWGKTWTGMLTCAPLLYTASTCLGLGALGVLRGSGAGALGGAASGLAEPLSGSGCLVPCGGGGVGR